LIPFCAERHRDDFKRRSLAMNIAIGSVEWMTLYRGSDDLNDALRTGG
jgi:hypothetical protein